MKLTITVAILFLLSPVTALAQTAEAKLSPPTIQKIAPNSYYYNYNIQEVQKDPDGDGPMEAEMFYQYNYVTIKGKPSKLKVLNAIAEAESNTATVAVEGVAIERTTVLEKLAAISAMTYTQIDTHIDNTFSNLSTAQKTSLKKLYKAVLALIKNMDLE